MSQEPNHNMDELLRAYAKERRDQAGSPLELHPATRQMLQSQVQSIQARGQPVSRSRGFGSLWPRLAFAGVFALVCLGVAYWQGLFSSSKQPVRYADVKSLNGASKSGPIVRKELIVERSKTEKTVSPMVAPAAAPVVSPPAVASGNMGALQESELRSRPGGGYVASKPVPMKAPLPETAHVVSPKKAVKAETPVATAPLAAAAVQSVNSAVDKEGADRVEAVSRLSKTVVAAEPVSPSMASDAVYGSAGVVGGTAGKALVNNSEGAISGVRFVSVDFSKQYRRNEQSPPTPKVLTGFTWNCDGLSVRAVDADGSVYAGTISGAATNGGNYSFRITGTNQTLKKLVVFSGNYASSAATNRLSGGRGGVTSNAVTSKPEKVRISGQVKIGGDEFPLVAEPAR